MKKKFLTVLTALALALSLSFGFTSAMAADEGIVGKTDEDWGGYGGFSVTYAENGFDSIGNIGKWGERSYNKNKVDLDGLEITIRMSMNVKDCFGFVLTSDPASGYFGEKNSPLAVTMWQDYYGGQTRLVFNANHDPAGAAIVHTSPAFTEAGFGIAGSMVMNVTESYDLKIGFDKVTPDEGESYYEITITSFVANSVWTSNANYTAEGLEEGATAQVKAYLKSSVIAPALDENGNTYVSFAGLNNGDNPTLTALVKVRDKNYDAYAEGALAAAVAAADEYRIAAAAIADEETYAAAMEKRTAFANAISSLRAYDKAVLTACYREIDASVTGNEDAVNTIKGLVQTDIDAATAAFAAFENESTLNDESLAAAKELVKKAKDNYEDKKTMLPEEEKTALETSLAALDRSEAYATALNWVVGYENAIGSLDVTAGTIGEDIAAVKATRAAFNGSKTEKILNSLDEDKKTALTDRISAGDAALSKKEEGAAVAVKEKYLGDLEAAVGEDLTVWNNIVAAYEKDATLKENVTLTEEDGEQYTRYNAAISALNAANEEYLAATIASVSEKLNGEFKTLESFNAVRGEYKAIRFDYLSEESERHEEITTAYAALTKKIEENVWYWFGTKGIGKTERTETGLYFEMTASFPNRINYNEKLDFTKGAEIVVEFTDIAYFNGDKTESGDSKGANNLCINFLDQPGVYKTTGKGISIIVWMFEMESSVDIVDGNDKNVVHSTLATPVQGGKLTISIKYEANYYDFAGDETYAAYVIKLNSTELVLPLSVAQQKGIDLGTEGYFSLGSFADYTADPNCFTIVSVNGKNLGEAKTPDPKPDPTPDSSDSQESGSSSTDGKTSEIEESSSGKRGCRGNVGTALPSVLALSLAGAAVALKKKKQNN